MGSLPTEDPHSRPSQRPDSPTRCLLPLSLPQPRASLPAAPSPSLCRVSSSLSFSLPHLKRKIIYSWLSGVVIAVHGLSPVAAREGRFSLQRVLKAVASLVEEHGL